MEYLKNALLLLYLFRFLLNDEFLKRQIGYNTKNALEKKKADGKILGRPRSIDNTTRNMVISMHEQGKRGYQIAAELGISTGTVSNYLKEHKNEKIKI